VTKTPGTPGSTFTSNGSANTKSTHLRALTIANQMSTRISLISASARFGTAGGSMLAAIRGGAAGTGGTANTPNKKNPNDRAADSTWFDDGTAITAGTTPVQQATVGFAQTGGQGGWVGLEIDDMLLLLANAGANGNLEFASFCNTAAVVFDATIGFQEN
jgi:hypothetical protein